jgi:hypothetical protein
MPLPLEAELTPEERTRILDRVAQEVTRRRLEVPAILALELHRPLTFLGSQALILFTPLLGAAFGLENLQKLAKLLEDRSNLDRLIDRIEEMAAQRRTADDRTEAAHEGRDADDR